MGLLDSNMIKKDFGWPLKDLFYIQSKGMGGICTNSLNDDLGKIITPIKQLDDEKLKTILWQPLSNIIKYYAALWHIDNLYDFKVIVNFSRFNDECGTYHVSVIVDNHRWVYIKFETKSQQYVNIK